MRIYLILTISGRQHFSRVKEFLGLEVPDIGKANSWNATTTWGNLKQYVFNCINIQTHDNVGAPRLIYCCESCIGGTQKRL